MSWIYLPLYLCIHHLKVGKLTTTKTNTHTHTYIHTFEASLWKIWKPTPNNRRDKSIYASISLLAPMVNDIEKKRTYIHTYIHIHQPTHFPRYSEDPWRPWHWTRPHHRHEAVCLPVPPWLHGHQCPDGPSLLLRGNAQGRVEAEAVCRDGWRHHSQVCA